jgi:hypothetical protein
LDGDLLTEHEIRQDGVVLPSEAEAKERNRLKISQLRGLLDSQSTFEEIG